MEKNHDYEICNEKKLNHQFVEYRVVVTGFCFVWLGECCAEIGILANGGMVPNDALRQLMLQSQLAQQAQTATSLQNSINVAQNGGAYAASGATTLVPTAVYQNGYHWWYIRLADGKHYAVYK